ncbi:hypothetical protein BFJ72_g4542 [Fusarium proliferatum]|uniref:Xylanolytic transcriptional activator regulatory domain-containing protein n=1 Tax=Gibberella intermedia TaxID=948311 RepID=A0A420TNJ9_GIBIN|nr:hypothetical protein BFJ72_g4542 [Fusarium proliferatum]
MNQESTPPSSGKRNKTVAFLNDLKRKAQDWDEVQKQQRNKTSADASTNENIVGEASPQQPGLRTSADDGLSQMTNPLLTPSSKFVVDHEGRKRTLRLDPSQSQGLTGIGFLGPSSTMWAMNSHLRVPLNHDGVAFNIELPSMKQTDLVVNIEGLPSLDYALYLTNTVKFHIVQTYHLFDQQKFMPALHSLYRDGPPLMTAGNRTWYVQYFLIMALGKGLLTRGMSKAGLPGNEYFMKAMELFPDTYGLYIDPILSTEVCCGLALYLQAVDPQNSAYLGMGLRTALSQRLHRDIAGDSADDPEVRRYRNAWWTLYLLDRKFSSLKGAPSSVQDSDISCTVLATRPILMCILRDKLEKSRHDNNANAEIAEPVKALVRTCYDSAHKSLRILTTLQSQDLLELFLPFDLDHAFSAGFVLALISTIQPFPDAASESSFELTRNILDALAAGWNLPARFRRQELERLHNMLHLIEQRDIVPQLQGQADIPVLGEQGISANQILNVASLLDGHTNLGADLDDVNGWLWEVTGFEGLHSV